MTTYDGRSASYVPGKEVPNREPPVSKFVVEKLYRVHRERIIKCQPTIDSHVKIPDFLTNQSWKKNAELQRQARIAKHNQEVYDRIAKVENAESQYTIANRIHVKRIEVKSGYLKKLKEHGRLVHLLKIQRENEYLLRRIEKAKPEYTQKKCAEWYRHHELFKAGRRSDPTAGHIMTNMGDVLPGHLPPLNYDGSSYNASDVMSSITRSKNKTLPSIGSSLVEEPSYLNGSSVLTSSVGDFGGIGFGSVSGGGSNANSGSKELITSMPPRPVRQSSMSNVRRTTTNTIISNSTTEDAALPPPQGSPKQKKSAPARESALAFSMFMEKKEVEGKQQQAHGGDHGSAGSVGGGSRFEGGFYPPSRDDPDSHSRASEVPDNESADTEELTLITSKPFAVPFDNKNCVVQVFSSKTYDENLYLKVVSSGLSSVKVYTERALPIDRAYDIVNAGGHSSQIVHSSDNEDLHSLSALLIDMFKEADDNGDGFLTFDEFQILMEKVELGISSQELRFVISEADENENGVVDYDEFVELGVDLIQSFRARNKAKNIITHQDIMLDEQIMKEISMTELAATADACLEKIYEYDTKKYGLIRLPDLKKCLTAVQTMGKINENELHLMCQMLPRDQFGRCKYNTAPQTFLEVLGKVKFATMKNSMVEFHGSGLQKYLIDLCKEEEARIDLSKGPKEKFIPAGVIPCRALINILNSAPRLSLSRLQVLVIMSEASVLDGMINYFSFIPVVAKAIEIMFEPKALRQRAELILKTDLSPEALLASMHSDGEVFQQRLKTLFKSFDIDNSDGLDQNEFVACLEALELQLTFGEMVALFENADESHAGHLKFSDFDSFFTSNLLNLERERHIRMLQSSMHLHYSHRHPDTSNSSHASNDNIDVKDSDFEKKFIEGLTAVFRLSDPEDTGLIAFSDFEDILKESSGVNISKFLLDVMLSELQTEVNGMVDYKKSLTTCADLLKVYKAKESAVEEHRLREEEAEAKSLLITQASIEDINHITRFLRKKIKRIVEGTNDVALRYNEYYRLFRDPHTGLSRFESNVLIKKLLHPNRGPKDTDSPAMYKDHALESDGDRTRPTSAFAPGVNVPNMRVVPSSFTGVFSTHDLFDAVFEARKSSVMRGLLEDVDSSTTQMTVIMAIEKELARLKEAGVIPGDSKYLPVQSCFSVLENAVELRLNRAQIMFIISWAECFDKEGQNLDAFKFADHAASIIAKLNLPAMLDTRVEVMNQGGIDEKKVLNGMKMKDIEHFLETQFSAMSDNGEITPDQLWETIKSIPKLKMSDREATTVVAAYHSSKVKWRDILSSTVTTIRSLCKERVINRRVSLAVSSNVHKTSVDATDSQAIREESMKLLKQLADKLLNFVKLQLQGDNIILTLPIDTEKRRATQLASEGSSNSSNSEMNHLFKGVRVMPTITYKSVTVQPLAPPPTTTPTATGARRVSSQLAMLGKPIHQIEEVKGVMPVLLHIVSVEDANVYAGGVSLVANAINVDASVTLSSTLSVKLPSIGIVDREAAEQYAVNLVDKMYIEQKNGVYTLKVSE